MKIFALRLKPGDDLKQRLKTFADQNEIRAGFIVSGIGSFQQIALRFADQPQCHLLHGRFELVSLAGTLSMGGLHLHMAIANSAGEMLGGHVMDGCLIYTTAEIIIGVSDDLIFRREIDAETGFLELTITADQPFKDLRSSSSF